MSELAAEYRRMAKPREVEGLADLYLIRPAGAMLVHLLRWIPGITPTTVSIMAVVAGWGCAWLYFRTSLAGTPTMAAVWGALVMLLHSALDSADGQLARLTGRFTDVGRLIDGFCDNLTFFGIYLGVLLGYVFRGGPYPWMAFALAAIAGASHSLQAGLSEYERFLYQAFAQRRYQPERHRPGALDDDIREATGPLGGFFQRLYRGYCHQQRLLVPSTARLEERILRLQHRDPEAVADLPSLWARYQGDLVPDYWLLATNVHKAAIVLCAFVPVWGDGFFAGLGMCWFYVVDLALNVPMAWLRARQARADERLDAVLDMRTDRGAALGDRTAAR